MSIFTSTCPDCKKPLEIAITTSRYEGVTTNTFVTANRHSLPEDISQFYKSIDSIRHSIKQFRNIKCFHRLFLKSKSIKSIYKKLIIIENILSNIVPMDYRVKDSFTQVDKKFDEFEHNNSIKNPNEIYLDLEKLIDELESISNASYYPINKLKFPGTEFIKYRDYIWDTVKSRLHSLKEIDISTNENNKNESASKNVSSTLIELKNSQIKNEHIPLVESTTMQIKLKNILGEYEQNKSNDSETYWEELFSTNMWMLSVITAYPVVLYRNQAYFGGMTSNRQNGTIGDILCRNMITGNGVIIELKTPFAPLVHVTKTKVRISRDVIDGLHQIIIQRHKWMREYANWKDKEEEKGVPSKDVPSALSPPMILLIGSLKQIEKENSEIVKCFELFRQQLKDIRIITFSEAFMNLKLLYDELSK